MNILYGILPRADMKRSGGILPRADKKLSREQIR